MTQFVLSQLQAQAILDMQLQRLTGLERQKILDEMAELLKTDRRLERDPRQRAAADAGHRRRAQGSAATSTATIGGPRSSTTMRRDQPRGFDRRRGHGDHGEQHRLHQAHADYELPQSAPRRQRAHRDAHARGGLRQPPVRGLDARLHHDFLGSRPRLLAQGPRDPGRRAGRQGQSDREPRVDGARRKDRSAANRERVRRGQIHRDGHRCAVS